MTIIREVYLCITKVIFMLKHSVKLRGYTYTHTHTHTHIFIYIYIYILGDVAACRRVVCVECSAE